MNILRAAKIIDADESWLEIDYVLPLYFCSFSCPLDGNSQTVECHQNHLEVGVGPNPQIF